MTLPQPSSEGQAAAARRVALEKSYERLRHAAPLGILLAASVGALYCMFGDTGGSQAARFEWLGVLVLLAGVPIGLNYSRSLVVRLMVGALAIIASLLALLVVFAVFSFEPDFHVDGLDIAMGPAALLVFSTVLILVTEAARCDLALEPLRKPPLPPPPPDDFEGKDLQKWDEAS